MRRGYSVWDWLRGAWPAPGGTLAARRAAFANLTEVPEFKALACCGSSVLAFVVLKNACYGMPLFAAGESLCS